MTAVVQLRDVQVRAGARVLLDVPALRIACGERVALVGANGAGKSTLLKLMGGLMAGRSVDLHGQVEVLGRPLHALASAQDRRALRRETGLLLQGLHLVPRLTAEENVLIGALGRLQGTAALCSLLRWYPRTLQAEAEAALSALGLAELRHTRADRLSGGERQKVALARLQLQQPRLLLADEPTSALDPVATTVVCEALRAVAAGPQRTLVTVVHDLALLPHLATRVIGMAAGRVAWDLPLHDVSAARLQALYGAGAEAPEAASNVWPLPATRMARA